MRRQTRSSKTTAAAASGTQLVSCVTRSVQENKKQISATFHFYGRLRGSLGMNKQEIIDLNLTDWVGIL